MKIGEGRPATLAAIAATGLLQITERLLAQATMMLTETPIPADRRVRWPAPALARVARTPLIVPLAWSLPARCALLNSSTPQRLANPPGSPCDTL